MAIVRAGAFRFRGTIAAGTGKAAVTIMSMAVLRVTHIGTVMTTG